VSLDKTERTGHPEHDSSIKRAVDKDVWAKQLEQHSWDRAAGTGQPGRDGPGQDSWTGQVVKDSLDRTAGAIQSGQDSQDRKAVTGELGQESQKDRRDSSARIRNRDRMARI
jgi:hypothetical protein